MENALNLPFVPLPLGAVKPLGWLRQQLAIQADGLTGHLDEFWPSIKDSSWIGGTAEGWERGPYWLDGLIPLAFQLNDKRLIAKAQYWVDYILANQRSNGWLGEVDDAHAGIGETKLDPWPQYVLLKAFAQWEEATGDARIIPATQRSLQSIAELLKEKPLTSWAKMRWQDLAYCVLWLYQRAPEPWLIELMQTAARQGYDWKGHFAGFLYTEKQPKWMLENHVVNHAMALKEPAMHAALLGVDAEEALAQTEEYIAVLDKWHGQVTGVFTGDESLAGRMPSQGTELCAVVEYLFSLEMAMGVFGKEATRLAERWERIAYNALPAPFTPDMCAHQYVQQVNQVAVGIFEDRVYTNNNADANVFGLEPHFGCCTANMHQGFPKLVQHLWMQTADGGVAANSYGPVQITATVAGDKSVTLITETEYPFRETVTIRLLLGGTAMFPLYLRIPIWCAGGGITVNGEAPEVAPSGMYHKIERTWRDGDVIHLTLPMEVVAEEAPGGGIAIVRGPLVYSLQIGEAFTTLKGDAPFRDYAITATTPWNYALLREESLSEQFTVQEHPLGAEPFASGEPPVTLTGTAYRLPTWEVEHSAAAPIPAEATVDKSAAEQITLVPFGSTRLRVTEFPGAKLTT